MAFMAYPTRGQDDAELNAAPDGAFTFGGGGGLLGGGGGGMGGLLGGLRSGAQDNSNLISALGMALMSGSRNNPFENMPQALVSGGTMDARERKARDEKQQQALARQAMVMSLTKGGMAPEEANLMAASPQAVSTWMQQEQNKKAEVRDARDFSFRQTEADRSQGNTNRSFGFQQTEAQRAQSNADRQFGLSEQTPAQRAARDLQVQPGSPEYKTFMDSQYKQGPTLHERDPTKELTRELPGGQFEVVRPAKDSNKDLPSEVRTYQFDMQQRQAAGQSSVPFQKWKADQAAKTEEGKPLPAEIAGRIGMANEFFRRYDNTRDKIEGGAITGLNAPSAQTGFKEPGAIMRDLRVGSEALFRMLTGAGSTEQEAGRMVKQYLPEATDTSKTAVDKLDRLRDALRSSQREALRGRMPQEKIDTDYPMFGGAGSNRYSGTKEEQAAGGAVKSGTYNYVPGKGLVPSQ